MSYQAVEDARKELCDEHEKQIMHEKLAEETLKLIKDFMTLTQDQQAQQMQMPSLANLLWGGARQRLDYIHLNSKL